MAFQSSYRQCFVSNTGTLLADGQTVDALAVGQIGILDGKTHKAVSAPTYAKNKAIKAVWGTPDLNVGEFGGVPNENEYSRLIKGKHIISFRANKAKRGVTPLYTVGWSGDVSDNDTLFAKAGESKSLFIKVTGDAIDRIHTKQGLIKYFNFTPQRIGECDDDCADVDCSTYVDQIIKQINRDKDLSPYLRASKILSCSQNETITETDCYKFKLTVCDTGDDYALGLVQSKYPTEKIKRIGRVEALSTYGVVKNTNSAPANYVSSPIVVTDCPTCPAGATLIEEGFKYLVEIPSGSTITVVDNVLSAVLLHTENGRSTYIVISETELLTGEVPAGSDITFTGETRNICQLPSTNTAWTTDGTLKKRAKKYRITLADGICGTNRLTDLQAAYPNLVVSVVNASGSCVHTYETTIQSECYEPGCSIVDIKYTAPQGFEGVQWVEVPPATPYDGCKCGILIETAFVNRKTGACSFEAFPYENDVVHVQISNYNPDFNADPDEKSWAFKQIRQVQYPAGHGQEVQQFEKDSKMYDQRFGHHDSVVREIQGYSLQAQADKYYDQYVLNFKTVWKTGAGWAENYAATWDLMFFVPEGTGAQLEKTLSSYVTSTGVDEGFESIV